MKVRDYVRHSIPIFLLGFNGLLCAYIYSRDGFNENFIVIAGTTGIIVLGLTALNYYVDARKEQVIEPPKDNTAWPPAIKELTQSGAKISTTPAFGNGFRIALVIGFLLVCAVSTILTVWLYEHRHLLHIHLPGF